jgi:hypothetical protein
MRTIKKWLRFIGVPPYAKEIDQGDMELLITLAILKAERPRGRFKLVDVLRQKLMMTTKQVRWNKREFSGAEMEQLLIESKGTQSRQKLYRIGADIGIPFSTKATFTITQVVEFYKHY